MLHLAVGSVHLISVILKDPAVETSQFCDVPALAAPALPRSYAWLPPHRQRHPIVIARGPRCRVVSLQDVGRRPPARAIVRTLGGIPRVGSNNEFLQLMISRVVILFIYT